MKRMTRYNNKAFTLIEFILILTIFSIMAGVTMFNFKGFRSNVALENLAYDLALSIQNIQQRAASGFGTTTVSGSSAIPIFQGIQFTKASSGFSSEFILFKDSSVQNQKYDSGTTELLDKIKIQYNEYVKSIEYDDDSDFTSATQITNDMAILFKRPWLDAYFYSIGSTNVLLPANSAQYLRITLASGGDASMSCSSSGITCKYIIISRAGQISVK